MAFVLKYCGNADESWYSTKKECVEDFTRAVSTLDEHMRGKCLATIHKGSIKNGLFAFDESPLFKLSIGVRGAVCCVRV